MSENTGAFLTLRAILALVDIPTSPPALTK